MAAVAPFAVRDSILVGMQNSIEVPVISHEEFQRTLGPLIARGGYGIIHEVLGTNHERVYKIIDSSEFKNGNEIRISQIASRLKVAPQFHKAFAFSFHGELKVVIEMDHGGKSLAKHMEDVGAKTAEPEPEPEEDTDSLDHLPPKLREMIKQKRACAPRFIVTNVREAPKASSEETVADIYEGNPETFYFQLFSRIKTLAEANISFNDTNVGNILPNPEQEEGLKLIDFDGASLENSVEDARAKSLMSNYTLHFLSQFETLEDLSEESHNLIQWFKV